MIYNATSFVIQTRLYNKGDTMKTLKEIRFVATNYANLQGLKSIPFSLCLVLLCLYVNGLSSTSRSFLVPAMLVIGMVLLYIAITRYYLHTFGRVQRTVESQRLETETMVAAGILALAAFWLDVSFKLPLSLIGLVFAFGLLADYLRITWLVKGRFLLYYPIEAGLILLISVLPIIGFPDWWHTIGLKSQLLGVSIAIGSLSIPAAIWGHIFLVRTLPPLTEEK